MTYPASARTADERAWWEAFRAELSGTRFIGTDAAVLERVLSHVGYYDLADNDWSDLDPVAMAMFVWVDWCLRAEGPRLTPEERQSVLETKAVWFPFPPASEGELASAPTDR